MMLHQLSEEESDGGELDLSDLDWSEEESSDTNSEPEPSQKKRAGERWDNLECHHPWRTLRETTSTKCPHRICRSYSVC